MKHVHHRKAKKQISKVDELKRAKKQVDPVVLKEQAKFNSVLEDAVGARAALQDELRLVKADKRYVELVKEGKVGMWDAKKPGPSKTG